MAVLSYRTWTSKFGTAPSVIGETIRVNGVPVTVVGVGPEGLSSSLHNGIVMDFWLSIPSLVLVGGEGRPEELERSAPDPLFLVTARLRDGVDLPQAEAAMTALGVRLAREFPDHDPGRGISVLRSDTVRIHPQFDGALSYGASSLMVLVGLLLAIACTNLATWLLVRGLSRGKEISVRLALGATRGQIVRHLLVESTLLAGAGGAVGCLLAVWAIRLVAQIDLPLDAGVGLDYQVLVFTLLLSLVTGVAFGLAPALKATRITLTPASPGTGPTRRRRYRRPCSTGSRRFPVSSRRPARSVRRSGSPATAANWSSMGMHQPAARAPEWGGPGRDPGTSRRCRSRCYMAAPSPNSIAPRRQMSRSSTRVWRADTSVG